MKAPDPSSETATADGQVPLDVASALVQLTGRVQSVYARIAERHDLTPMQAKLLCIVAESPRAMGDLAQCFGVAKAALTGLVDRAERRGLAQRCPVPADRRAVHVTPTDTGRRDAAAFHAEVSSALDGLLAPLTEREREQFRRSMTKLLAAQRPVLSTQTIQESPRATVPCLSSAAPGSSAARWSTRS
jgi:DNA-binding MarR family transcriptional regulator